MVFVLQSIDLESEKHRSHIIPQAEAHNDLYNLRFPISEPTGCTCSHCFPAKQKPETQGETCRKKCLKTNRCSAVHMQMLPNQYCD